MPLNIYLIVKNFFFVLALTIGGMNYLSGDDIDQSHDQDVILTDSELSLGDDKQDVFSGSNVVVAENDKTLVDQTNVSRVNESLMPINSTQTLPISTSSENSTNSINQSLQDPKLNSAQPPPPVITGLRNWDENVADTIQKIKDIGWKKLTIELQNLKMTEEVDLEALLNVMKNFSHAIFNEQGRQETFYSLLLQLNNKLFFVTDKQADVLSTVLNDWLGCSVARAKSNKLSIHSLQPKLDYLLQKADEYMNVSFLSPTNFSATVEQLFEMSENLLQRLKFIKNFKKLLGDDKSSLDVVTVNTSVFELLSKCLILQTFEQFYGQDMLYGAQFSNLSIETLNEFVSSVLINFKQIQEMFEFRVSGQLTLISVNAKNSLDYLLKTMWRGLADEVDHSVTADFSVRGFLEKLKTASLAVIAKNINEKDKKKYGAINIFLKTANNKESQKDFKSFNRREGRQDDEKRIDKYNFSLDKFLNILKKLNLGLNIEL